MSENKVSFEDRTKVYETCKSQLGGKWAEVNESDLFIRPAADGFINKLFICCLPQNIETKFNEVVVRYVDSEAFKDFVFVETHVMAISLIMSEELISPRLLSVFQNGTINEYIKCRYFDARDDLNNKTVELLAQNVAKIHSLEAPIPKDTVQKTMDGIFVNWFDKELRESYTEGVVRKEIEKHKYPVLSKLDFIEELNWMRKTIENLNSPIVLSHNDLNRRNILIRDQNNNELELFLIDFDMTSYNYRGMDLGHYFAFYKQKEVDFGYIQVPSDQQMSVFIDAYIKQMCELFGPSYGQQKVNSRERLIKEAKIFTLYTLIKDTLYCLWKATMTEDKAILAKGEMRFGCYDELKTRVLREYINL